MNSRARLSARQIIARLAVAAVVWFGCGLGASRWLGMAVVDSVAFLLCLGVVFLIGAVVFAAVYGPQGESQEG